MNAQTQGLHGGLNRAMSREQNNFSIWGRLIDDLNDFKPIHAGHFEIYDHQVHGMGSDVLNSGLPVWDRCHDETFQFQNIGERLPGYRFVIND